MSNGGSCDKRSKRIIAEPKIPDSLGSVSVNGLDYTGMHNLGGIELVILKSLEPRGKEPVNLRALRSLILGNRLFTSVISFSTQKRLLYKLVSSFHFLII